jgi:hypothetical protein
VGRTALTHAEKESVVLALAKGEHVERGCGRTFSAPMPGALTTAPLTHECRYHVFTTAEDPCTCVPLPGHVCDGCRRNAARRETGECLCPCGARTRLRP